MLKHLRQPKVIGILTYLIFMGICYPGWLFLYHRNHVKSYWFWGIAIVTGLTLQSLMEHYAKQGRKDV